MIALSGTPAPIGGTYASFGVPNLNENGQISFPAILIDSLSAGAGIFVGAPGSLQAIALAGAPSPGGGNYASFGFPILNALGEMTFIAPLTGSSSAQGIFAGHPGLVQTLVLHNSPTPEGGSYEFFRNVALNNSGRVAFIAELTNSSSHEGVFLSGGPQGSVRAVALFGDPAPDGGNFNTFFDHIALNENNSVAFRCWLSGGASTWGIFVGTPGSVQPIALQGTAAPLGGNYGTLFDPSLNSLGVVAFSATLSGGSSSQGIFMGTPGAIDAIALVGSVATPNANFRAFYNDPIVNDAGQVAFRAALTSNGPGENEGIFVGVPGAVEAVALGNAAAPLSSEPPGSYFRRLFFPPVLNSAGQVAFLADLSGAGMTPTNNSALFAGSPGRLVQIVREGDTIDVDPSPAVDLRTVSPNGILFAAAASGGCDGRGMSFNDKGLLVYRLTFTDGSRGVFASKLPCPGDFDASGAVDATDIFAFLDAWFAQLGQHGAALSADIDRDTTVNATDIFVFLDTWFSSLSAACP